MVDKMVDKVVDKALLKVGEKATLALFKLITKLVIGRVEGHLGNDTLSSKIRKLISSDAVTKEEAENQQITNYVDALQIFNEGK